MLARPVWCHTLSIVYIKHHGFNIGYNLDRPELVTQCQRKLVISRHFRVYKANYRRMRLREVCPHPSKLPPQERRKGQV